MKKLPAAALAIMMVALLSMSAFAGDEAVKKEQFLYKLKLIPHLLDENKWTDKDNKIVEEHFEWLKTLLVERKLVLAGRTLNMDPTGFGIVILEVESERKARKLMEADPAVREGIMTAELFPYRVALIRSTERDVRKSEETH